MRHFAGEETSDVHRYDVAGDKWEEVEKGLPEAVSVALCFAVRDKIVMFGGEVEPSKRGHAGAGNFRDGRIFLIFHIHQSAL